MRTRRDTSRRLAKIHNNKRLSQNTANVKSIVSGSPARSTVRLTTVYMETCQLGEEGEKTRTHTILFCALLAPSHQSHIPCVKIQKVPRPLKDAPATSSSLSIRALKTGRGVMSDLQRAGGDGTLRAVEAELDRDDEERADCMCLCASSPAANGSRAPAVLERHPRTKGAGWLQKHQQGSGGVTRGQGLPRNHNMTAERTLDAGCIIVYTVAGVFTTEATVELITREREKERGGGKKGGLDLIRGRFNQVYI